MANQQQLELLRQGVTEHWNRWRLEYPDTRPELQAVDLTGANLGGADLANADLSWADLSEADLNNANLSGAKLVGANLSGANLASANLSGADLSGASLVGADLTEALLNEANLTNANVRAANLSWTNRDEAIISAEQLNNELRTCPLYPPDVVYRRERKETRREERKGKKSHATGSNNFHKTETITAHGGPADRAVAAAFWHLQPASSTRSQSAEGHGGH